jgi:glycosyltransferase involved in cell wall biosynthesis
MTVYNGMPYLRPAVESALGQTLRDFRFVIVNDGSTDGTAEALEAFKDRVQVVQQEQRGPAAARNRGLELATGELFAFVDADDLWIPGRLKRQIACFESRPGLDLCAGKVQNFWMEELADEEARFRDHPFSRPLPGYHLGAVLIARDFFDSVGPFDESLRVASDNEWFLRAREQNPVEVMLPEVVLRRRLHLHNLTRPDLASRDALLSNLKASLDRRRASS